MNKTIHPILLVALLLMLLAPIPVRADHVRLRSGKVIEGVLAAPADSPSAAGKVRIWVGPSQIALALEQVDSITTDSLADNLLIDARCQLAGRRLDSAAEKMGQAVREGLPPEKLVPLISRYSDELTTAVPRLKASARAGLSQALGCFAGTPAAGNPELALRLLDLHLALGEDEQSQAILTALGPQYFSQNPAAIAHLSDSLLRTLEAWAEAEDFAGGQATLDMLRRISPRQADAAAIQFYLQWGSVERHGGRYESALRIYSQYMMRLAPQIAIDRTTTTLMELEKDAREKKRLLDVVGLYETYAKPICPAYALDRLALIWRDEGRVRMWDGKLAEARDAFTRSEQYKKGAAARELAELEWRQRRAALAKDDFKGHLALGQWCQEKDLFDQALTELRQAEESPALATEAGNRIETIRSKQAEAKLAEIMTLYEAGNYARVIDEVAQFMRQDHPAGYLAQAKQLSDMTREAMQLYQAQRPQQAESLYKQAERALYEDDYLKAKSLLEALMTHYRDTATYPRAGALAAVVEQRLAVAEMESGRKTAAAAAGTSATLAGLSVTSGTQARVTNMIDQQPAWAPGARNGAPNIVNNAPLRAPQPPARTAPAKGRADSTSTTQPGSRADNTVNDALRKLMEQEGIHNGQ